MYPEITEVTQVALEGSPSNVPLLSGAACAGDTQFDWIPAVETDTVPAGMATLCQALAQILCHAPTASPNRRIFVRKHQNAHQFSA